MNQTLPVILIVAFDGYQQVEYVDTKKAIEQAGLIVKTASTLKGAAIAKDGSTCQIDLKIEEIDPKTCAGVFLIGGPGALDDLNTLKMHAIIQKIVAAAKPCGAICISTRILAQAGVLDNKKATGWNDDHKLEALYKAHHTTYVKSPVVLDDIIITAQGPDAAKEFGNGIVSLVKK
jgi:putative intracellular protease/amidase